MGEESVMIFMNMICDFQLVEYTRTFLEKSWGWLHDEYVKHYTVTPDFTKEQQESWFLKLMSDNQMFAWGGEYEGIPIGACGLKISSEGDSAEYWGYIGEKELYGKGLGTEMLRLTEQKATDLYIKRLWLKVLPDNKRALRVYCKRGFKEFGRDATFVYMEKLI